MNFWVFVFEYLGSIFSISRFPKYLESVGDPHLLSVDDQVVARPPGGGLAGGHVAASSRLADTETSHGLQGAILDGLFMRF